MKTPTERITKTECSVCGLDWKAHGPKPTLETCVRLLKAELARPRLYPPFAANISATPSAFLSGMWSS